MAGLRYLSDDAGSEGQKLAMRDTVVDGLVALEPPPR